ncbi:MAG: isoleucine--tRNA ligase [Alphaproteobacteria bacterium]|nr:isoleucine--tRNA ligase [Alphaproteobacteria bacterium]
MKVDYKNTVFLPKTEFAMKANLAKREPDFLNYWKSIDLYASLRRQSKDRKKFILHFGPPYANGHIHIGHALTESLKDIVNKTYQMLGYDAAMVPGWDCHGLPIEWKIEESYRDAGLNKDDVDPLEFRAECRTFAAKWVDVQREEFKRLGIVADWDNPYSTMNFKTEARIIEQLGQFLLNGSLYRGQKPVMWSVVEKTSLAEAEVEYKDHTSDSVFVSFPIIETPLPILKNASAVIWTTTPWTLPGNRAIAFGEEIDYSVVKSDKFEHSLLIASSLVESLLSQLEIETFQLLGTLKGKTLQGTVCAHPLRGKGYEFPVPLLSGEYVTTEAGTGLVHTAPGHGLEDFEVGQKHNLEVPALVADDGRYYDHVPLFAGLHVFKANAKVMEAIQEAGHLLHSSKLIHSYPHSWRSKAPLIYRTTPQWFVSMETNDLRTKALKAIEEVSWFPAQAKNRIRSMVEGRPDWNLSRQRAWGTPMTLFIHKQTGDVLRDAEVHARIVDAVALEGGDTWYTSDASRFLGSKYDPESYVKVMDILDVWFDSGCTHEFVLKDRPDLSWPADLYLEGSDQHRGWFQSSLLEACGTIGKAPYRQVLTHGFTLDEKGHKMSKSQGNTISPSQVIDSMGADILRLWVVSVDYTEDHRIGTEILKYQEDVYRRLRNTLRYLLGALEGFTPSERVETKDMPYLEQWVLHRLSELDVLLRKSAENFDFMNFYADLHTFCAVDLSAFYFDLRKDCLYCDAPSSLKRRAVRTVMDHIFTCLTHWLAPVLSFTTEEAWQTRYGEEMGSIHLQMFPEIPLTWKCESIATQYQTIRDVRRVITGALEVERGAKTIGSSLQADVAIYVPHEIAEILKALNMKDPDLAEFSITSAANLVIAQPPAGAFILEDVLNVGVVVNTATGQKCNRCWKVLEEVGQVHADLCKRCKDVIEGS